VLTLLKIKNIALIDELTIEFGDGLNLLTGETGSGKSIIVDSLAALTGERVSGDLIKQGEDKAQIEGLFSTPPLVSELFEESGIEPEANGELIVRRELSLAGKNRVFVNNQLVTQGFLKKLGTHLVDIHGQGEQASLYAVESHIAMLDDFAGVAELKKRVAEAFRALSAVKAELSSLEKDESEKLQLLDILRFQADEISRAALQTDEDTELEDEKRRLNNVEKLSTLSDEVYDVLYESDASTVATLERAARSIAELAEYDTRFREYEDGLNAAQAVLNDAAISARDFRAALEFSPERLNEIENRLAEISRLKRKYGESIEAVLAHLADATQRLENIETAEFREEELKKQLAASQAEYQRVADELHNRRVSAATKFAKQVEQDLKAVALEKARLEIGIEQQEHNRADGTDRVEFYFSANPGEPVRPLAKVASGGEASRLMLILKTAARSNEGGRSAVFDEIDIGIGGRVAEAVGRKLKDLAANAQVFCVTHQPQIASLADRHFLVEKYVERSKTTIGVRDLSATERIEELARMLAGERVTDEARENAKAMLAAAK
jgi:DNA repair protein RecN (Recombination protein N)